MRSPEASHGAGDGMGATGAAVGWLVADGERTADRVAALGVSSDVGVVEQLWVANDFDDFELAVRTKIGEEVTPIPEPGTLLLLGSGITGLAMRRRRNRK